MYWKICPLQFQIWPFLSIENNLTFQVCTFPFWKDLPYIEVGPNSALHFAFNPSFASDQPLKFQNTTEISQHYNSLAQSFRFVVLVIDLICNLNMCQNALFDVLNLLLGEDYQAPLHTSQLYLTKCRLICYKVFHKTHPPPKTRLAADFFRFWLLLINQTRNVIL